MNSTKTETREDGVHMKDASPDELHTKAVAALKTCYDPEIPVDIYELGLIYEIEIEPGGVAHVTMTLTSPMCPVAESLPVEVKHKLESIDGITAARVDLVWEPSWEPAMMSEAARLELGF
jgi:FeS assembly SUF system protein